MLQEKGCKEWGITISEHHNKKKPKTRERKTYKNNI